MEEHCCIVKVGLFGLFSNSFPLKQGSSYLKNWIKDPAAISMFMMKVDFLYYIEVWNTFAVRNYMHIGLLKHEDE